MDHDLSLKIIMVGESGVGKTSILEQITHKRFTEHPQYTIGVEYGNCMVYSDKVIKLNIWDTAGQERYRSITTGYFRDADACVVIFDLTNMESFRKVGYWINEAKSKTTKIPILLVGNKEDLTRQVSIDQANKFAIDNNLPYVEISAKSYEKTRNMFEKIALLFCKNNLNSLSITERPLLDTYYFEEDDVKNGWKNKCCT